MLTFSLEREKHSLYDPFFVNAPYKLPCTKQSQHQKNAYLYMYLHIFILNKNSDSSSKKSTNNSTMLKTIEKSNIIKKRQFIIFEYS